MRDLQADKAICEEATPGPWKWEPDTWNGGYSGITGKDDISVLYADHCNDGDCGAAWFEELPCEKDGKFMVEARVGWPDAIERAIAAEAKIERMQKVVLSARPLFKFLENAGIYRDLTLPDLAVRPYNDLMTRLEEALVELEAVE